MKTCPKCGESKPTSEFGLDKSTKDGFSFYCSICKRVLHRKHYSENKERWAGYSKKWREKNREYKAAKDKEYQKNNPERRREITRRYRERHKEQIREYATQYTAKNKEVLRQKSKEWRQNNPEKHRMKEARRRTRKNNNGVFYVAPSEIVKMLRLPCFYCGGNSEHIDHVVPISRGGTHGIGNLVQACARCNISKSDRFIVEWKKVANDR